MAPPKKGFNPAMQCDQDVFQYGTPIVLVDARSVQMEAWVTEIRRSFVEEFFAFSVEKIDWHYSGGIAQLLHLGTKAGRAKIVEIISRKEKVLDGRILRFLEEESGLYRRGVDESPDSAMAGFYDPISGKQFFFIKE